MRDHQIGQVVDVSDFIHGNFKKPSAKIEIYWWTEANEAVYFLKNMNFMGYIEVSTNFDFAAHIGSPDGKRYWFDSPFYAHFKVEGFNYLQQYYQQQSIFTLNAATRKNYKYQIILTVVIALSAISGGWISWLNYQVSIQKNDKVIKDLVDKNIKDTLLKIQHPKILVPEFPPPVKPQKDVKSPTKISQ